MRLKIGTTLYFIAAALFALSAIDGYRSEDGNGRYIGATIASLCLFTVGLLNLREHKRQQRRDQEA